MMLYCWSDVVDGWLTVNQHWFNVLCLLGSFTDAANMLFSDHIVNLAGIFDISVTIVSVFKQKQIVAAHAI